MFDFPCRAEPRQNSRLLAGALLALLLPLTVSAQSADPEGPSLTVDEEITVSAHRAETPVDESGSSVTVIGREEIERRHAVDVGDLLRTVPGIEVVQSGGPGMVSSVFMRGGNSSHTLVMVDGVRLNSNGTGAFDFADLRTDNIERIEILRGPQGSLYGSEAVAGVISIFTRRGEGVPRFHADVEAGSHDHARLVAGVDGSSGSFDYSLTVSNLSTDGVSSARESAGNDEDDPYDHTTVAGRFGKAFAGDGRLDLTLRYLDGDVALDGFAFGVGPVDDLNSVQFREALTGGLTLTKPLGSRFVQTFFLGATSEDLSGEDPDDVFNNFAVESDNLEFFSQTEVSLAESENFSDTLVFGLRYEDRDAASVGAFDRNEDLTSFFFENRWSFAGRHHLTASARHDDHSLFGGETTYRLALSSRLASFSDEDAADRAGLPDSEGLRFHGSFGTGFKAPTFNELFFPGFGNLDLDPETSEGFDAGLEATFAGGRVLVDATYFDNEFEDLILFTFPGGFQNVAEATADGVELRLRYEPSKRFFIEATHTRTDSEDLATGLALPRRPRDRSTLFLAFEPLERLRGTAVLYVVSDRIDSDGSAMDDYERLDLSVDYRVNDWLQPYVRIQNLFDEDYEEVTGFTTPGTAAAVGLRLGR